MPSTVDVVTAIKAHHAELEAAVTDRADTVITAARTGRPHEPAVAELRAVLEHEVVPHARAEEDVLYAAAIAEPVRLLVAGMVFEHETLLGLVGALAAAVTAVDAAAVAGAVREIFVGHVRRENDLLLPQLAADPAVDLTALLPVMHERFTAYRRAAA
jgi:hypothetical protein